LSIREKAAKISALTMERFNISPQDW